MQMAENVEIAAAVNDVDKKEKVKAIDADMIAEIEATGVHDVLTAGDVAEDFSPHAVSFTQFMGTAETSVNDFLESGYIMANLDGSLTTFIANALVATRYALYMSLCIMVGALVTGAGMVLDRLVIAAATKTFEINVGSKGKVAFLLIFGVLGMACTCLIGYWLYQGPVWLPLALIGVFVATMFGLHKSPKGKKWFDEMIECLYLIIAPKLFVWKYILAWIGKDKIQFPYDVSE